MTSRVDCAECDSAGSVERGLCQVCYAEPGEGEPVAADLPPAASPGPLRLRDVIDELRAVAGLASAVEDAEMLMSACRRADQLLHALRDQFLVDLGVVS